MIKNEILQKFLQEKQTFKKNFIQIKFFLMQ